MKHRRTLGLVALAAAFTSINGSPLQAAVRVFAPHLHLLASGRGGTHAAQGYLGVETRDISPEELAGLKLKEVRGVIIINLDHDGPACKAGMRVHDVILSMDGQRIDFEEQLRRALKDLPAGRSVSFLVSRDGQTQTVTLQTADRRTVGIAAWDKRYIVPAPQPTPAPYVPHSSFVDDSPASAPTPLKTPQGHRDLFATNVIMSSSYTGAELEVMGLQLAEFFGAEGGAGLLVRSVDPSSPADQAGLKAGDVVVRVNSVPVTNGNEWTKTVHDSRGRAVSIDVLRDHHPMTLSLIPDNKKRSSLRMDFGLEGFFEQTADETRDLIAKL